MLFALGVHATERGRPARPGPGARTSGTRATATGTPPSLASRAAINVRSPAFAEAAAIAEPYWLVRAGEDEEAGANGALVSREELHQAPVLIAGVADIDDVLSRVDKCGGTVVQGKLPIPGMGWSAYICDPEGNTIGFFQPDTNAAAST